MKTKRSGFDPDLFVFIIGAHAKTRTWDLVIISDAL